MGHTWNQFARGNVNSIWRMAGSSIQASVHADDDRPAWHGIRHYGYGSRYRTHSHLPAFGKSPSFFAGIFARMANDVGTEKSSLRRHAKRSNAGGIEDLPENGMVYRYRHGDTRFA